MGFMVSWVMVSWVRRRYAESSSDERWLIPADRGQRIEAGGAQRG